MKSARSLVQEIAIPEFGIHKTQSQATHLVHGEHPTIFIALDSESPHFTTYLISHSLAELFGVPTLRSDIALILNTPEHRIDNSFWCLLNVPELPSAWITIFEASPPPSHLNPLQTSRVESNSELEMSVEEADDIVQFINTWEQSSKETCDFSAKDDTLNLIANSMMPSMERRSVQQSMDDEEEAETEGSILRSGFAGEFFVPSFAMLFMLDISETRRKSSRVFERKLDQLPETLCRISALRRRTI